MDDSSKDLSLEAIQDIRNIMDRSARFVSLAGMSGIWAGVVALLGSALAWKWISQPYNQYMPGTYFEGNGSFFDPFTLRLICLGLAVFVVALAGAFYFTWKKARKANHHLWNAASKQLLIQGFFPLLAGAVFCLSFIYYGYDMFIVPSCLVFYGLALISGSRHTLSDIRYLGVLDILLGFCSLFLPGYAILCWATGFGALHIIYGAMMWNKYDKNKKPSPNTAGV